MSAARPRFGPTQRNTSWNINIWKKSVTAAAGAGVAGATATAPLFLGAGTAQAETSVEAVSEASGVAVVITSINPSPSLGWCTYSAVPLMVPPGVAPPEPVHDAFQMQRPHEQHRLFFPGPPTGTTWKAHVHCVEGADSGPQQFVY